jgi:DNA-binding CsgD family transcriptional regulator
MAEADIYVFPGARRRRIKPGAKLTYRAPKTTLSPRETEVCKLLVTGLKVKEVALQLNISIHATWMYARNAYLKLDVHDRGGLVRHFALPNVIAVRDTLTDSMSRIHAIENSEDRHDN